VANALAFEDYCTTTEPQVWQELQLLFAQSQKEANFSLAGGCLKFFFYDLSREIEEDDLYS
jgi:hypothetical protein